MAVVLNDTRDQVKAVYKIDYDVTGDFPTLADFSQTFSYVKETATNEQKKAMVDALMGLTVYRGSPYRVQLVSTSRMVTT